MREQRYGVMAHVRHAIDGHIGFPTVDQLLECDRQQEAFRRLVR